MATTYKQCLTCTKGFFFFLKKWTRVTFLRKKMAIFREWVPTSCNKLWEKSFSLTFPSNLKEIWLNLLVHDGQLTYFTSLKKKKPIILKHKH
jgi:hypothetical protein